MIGVVLAASFLAGCVTNKPEVGTYIDPFTRARTDLMAENMLDSPEPIREVVWLNASRLVQSGRDHRYYLEVDYIARAESGFLDIPPGETLVILADDQELKFTGTGSLNSKREQKGEVHERAIYLAAPEQLRAIAAAETVKVSVLGRNGMVQRTFNQMNHNRFDQFVQRYVSGE